MSKTPEQATAPKSGSQNRGICPTCGCVAKAHHEEHDDKVYLVKECAKCGRTESLVASSAEMFRAKREMVGYEGEAVKSCSLNCPGCALHKDPTLVFIDVTNRCNMNCPICLANIPAMGFRFDPPMAYFEKIFARLAEMDPKPKIQLFGGEPTVREDLIDMIRLAKDKYGLSARVVTNGLRLDNEDYCRELLATGTQLMFSFDGRNPEIYRKTRRNPKAYERKLQGLENAGKYYKSKVTIMCAVGEGINDGDMADLIDYCHERRHYIAALDLIPLTATWGPEEVEAETATIEDVERIMDQQIPGMEFFPAAVLYRLDTLLSTFSVGRLTFGGAHPNCEQVSLLISDGEHYWPLARYLRRPMRELVSEVLELDRDMSRRLPTHPMARLFGQAGRRLVYGARLFGIIRREVRLSEVFTGSTLAGIAQIGWGLLRRRKMKDLLRANTRFHNILRLIILPFEDVSCLESARLVDCPAAFGYVHPETDEVRLMPVCAWPMYKNDILRALTEQYGIDPASGRRGLSGLSKDAEPEDENEPSAAEAMPGAQTAPSS